MWQQAGACLDGLGVCISPASSSSFVSFQLFPFVFFFSLYVYRGILTYARLAGIVPHPRLAPRVSILGVPLSSHGERLNGRNAGPRPAGRGY